MKQGVDYVVGTQPQTPVLRPLRQPLYDSEIYPAAGTSQLEVFIDRSKFANGTNKGLVDTNLTQDGSLGTPLQFDLVGFQMEYAVGTSFEDLTTLYNEGTFQWVFGQNTIWLQVKDTKIPQGTGLTGDLDAGAAPRNVLTNGWPAVNQFYNFTDPTRHARRITSNESFKCRKNYSATAVSADVKFTVYMLGLLYAQL